jgi:hypothetical protein
VDFTEAATRHLWDAQSSSSESNEDDNSVSGAECQATKLKPTHLSLLVTPNHHMYVQQLDLRGGGTSKETMPFRRVVAEELTPGFMHEQGGDPNTSTIRMLHKATNGFVPSAGADDAAQSLSHRLGLHTRGALDAFLQLYGMRHI